MPKMKNAPSVQSDMPNLCVSSALPVPTHCLARIPGAPGVPGADVSRAVRTMDSERKQRPHAASISPVLRHWRIRRTSGARNAEGRRLKRAQEPALQSPKRPEATPAKNPKTLRQTAPSAKEQFGFDRNKKTNAAAVFPSAADFKLAQ
ncbi:MAG: hypothetical protein DBX55_03915 [Verrucomicrobia bacterium]|nr:MAG: hypothetical protein DBX55_03915 [Verrucomicrobiota bacterium]